MKTLNIILIAGIAFFAKIIIVGLIIYFIVKNTKAQNFLKKIKNKIFNKSPIYTWQKNIDLAEDIQKNTESEIEEKWQGYFSDVTPKHSRSEIEEKWQGYFSPYTTKSTQSEIEEKWQGYFSPYTPKNTESEEEEKALVPKKIRKSRRKVKIIRHKPAGNVQKKSRRKVKIIRHKPAGNVQQK